LLFSIGSYAWFEIDTQKRRIELECRAKKVNSFSNTHWQCRQSLNVLISSLQKTGVILFEDNKMLLRRDELLLLQDVNFILYQQLSNLLKGIGQSHPNVYQAFLSGEEIQLSAWQLRREYKACEWLIN